MPQPTHHPTPLPPQATALEEAVLGACMLDGSALSAVAAMLHSEHFYKAAHAHVWRAISTLYRHSQPVDLLTVVEQLRKDGNLEAAGGSFGVSELTNRVASTANVETHARIIIQKWMARQVMALGYKSAGQAHDDQQDIFDLIDTTTTQLMSLTAGVRGGGARHVSAMVAEDLQDMEALRTSGADIPGLPTGNHALDKALFGWEEPNLYIVAARPGMGKTAWLITRLAFLALDKQLPCALFSLEMSGKQITKRMESQRSGIPFEKLKRANYAPHDHPALQKAADEIAEAPLWIADKPGINVMELRSTAIQLKQQHDIRLLAVDYLQLINGVDGRGRNREQEISEISRTLKHIARELNIPVIALSQLSRAVETRGGDKRPQLSDLRESGAIEQDADAVIFLYRPEYYEVKEYSDGTPTAGVSEAIIAKNRHGVLDTVFEGFVGRNYLFTEIDMRERRRPTPPREIQDFTEPMRADDTPF